jgi:vacuolar protein 8
VEDHSAEDDSWLGTAFALGRLLPCLNANNAAVLDAGSIPQLVELLRDGSLEGRANAAAALYIHTFCNDATTATIVAAGALPPLVELLRGGLVAGRARGSREYA